MSERSLHIKIPLERIGVLIGHEGRVKEILEKKLGVKIGVDSVTGDVELASSEADPSILFRARDMVHAIGRGFSPEKAFKLLNEDLNLYIIDLQEFFTAPSNIQRVKSRVIGKGGKTRLIIEEETTTSISVYGHTVSIIGDMEHIDVAREAVEMLIKGSLHHSVYRFLNARRSELKKIEMEIWKPAPDILKKERKKRV